ncbi:MAG TPA: NADH-quinone oxidoreductase subunit L [Candidatus Acidoferrales bacterium]|jgi:NADH-quinone oxidoreductase subunit L|nr:NADH-quinone oxidoreductase subunit L [Candidatus Acidoferrales bacterium]
MMPTEYFLAHIWLIPLFPLVGAALMLFVGRRLPNAAVNVICVGSVFLAMCYAFGAIWQLVSRPAAERLASYNLFDWVPAGAMHTNAGNLMRFNVPWGVMIDPLTCVMLFVVTGVGFLIHVYSTGYMAHEGGYYRFFGYLNLFMFSMLTLITANNLLLLFVGWEGVGLCSYLLIGFYFLRKSASDAGKKAFIVNRIGDAGFLLGLFLMLGTLGTIQFTEIGPAIAGGHFAIGDATLTAIALLLFVGATGKSAQLPLYVWLPDAMEGPTPVSALIHAATMVTAGVYMIARTNAVFSMAPNALTVVAVVGCVTSIFAATMGLVQNDIKRVLAYSTVSQLGYMFLACGVGAFTAGVFHLMTHAFFKALLFLGSGSVIHALSGEQDMRKMGGLWEKIPKTAKTFVVASIAISGIPPLAGFFSKDAILSHAFEYNKILWLLGLITAGMTAFYMFRLVIMTFFGESRVDHEVAHHIHESPSSMTVPLMILAVLSVVGGWVGVPESLGGSDRFAKFLEPVMAAHGEEGGEAAAAHAASSASMEYLLMLLSVLIACAGIWLAYRWYIQRPQVPEKIAATSPFLYRLVYHKYYVDELYDAMFVNRVKDLALTLGAFDVTFINGLGVDGSGWVTRITSTISGLWDSWIVDGLVNLTARIVWLFSWPVRMLQTGRVARYALFMLLGVLVFLGYYLWTSGFRL